MTSPSGVRRQLTLFLPAPQGPALDTLRAVLDPVQADLIAAHVTLCREDELARWDWPALQARLQAWPGGPLELGVGPPQRFDGHGLLLPCIHGQDAFQALRCWVLQDEAARPHDAHVTLAHPRNPRAVGNVDEALRQVPTSVRVRCRVASWIEQLPARPWQVRAVVEFAGNDEVANRRDVLPEGCP